MGVRHQTSPSHLVLIAEFCAYEVGVRLYEFEESRKNGMSNTPFERFEEFRELYHCSFVLFLCSFVFRFIRLLQSEVLFGSLDFHIAN